jgi:hypothetical protein
VRLCGEMELPNGLRLQFWDESRPIAGDRWYAGLRAVLAVEIPPEATRPELGEGLQLLKEALGPVVYYQRLMERHFVARQDVPSVLREMRESFLANSLGYLSHKDFPARFLLAKAGELQKKRNWGQQYVEKVLEELRPPQSPRAEG